VSQHNDRDVARWDLVSSIRVYLVQKLDGVEPTESCDQFVVLIYTDGMNQAIVSDVASKGQNVIMRWKGTLTSADVDLLDREELDSHTATVTLCSALVKAV